MTTFQIVMFSITVAFYILLGALFYQKNIDKRSKSVKKKNTTEKIIQIAVFVLLLPAILLICIGDLLAKLSECVGDLF